MPSTDTLRSGSETDKNQIGKNQSGTTMLDRMSFAGFVVAILGLTFLAGAMVVILDVFPAPFLKNAYRGGLAFYHKMEQSRDPLTSDFWQPERRPDAGVTINTGEAFPGYTLYTSGHGSEATLIDLDGNVVHSWSLKFSQIWNETSPVKSPQQDSFFYWRKAQVFPNGDLLAIFVATGDTPWGYGMVRVDRDSQVLWSYLGQTHHDFDIAPNGRVYALTHEMRNVTYELHDHLTVPRLDDFLVVLSPEGKELKKISILDALVDSDYTRLLDRVVWYNKHDFIHTNSVDFIDAARARALGFAKEGQVLISFRDIDTIALLDVDAEKIVWALRGSWLAQHDPDVLPNGNILLYDNIGGLHVNPGGTSRILEVNPRNGAVVWSYAGSLEQPFESEARGAQERLPNGNTLITETAGGRIFEVTRDGRIVWEYINPVRAEDPKTPGQSIVPIVSWGQRIPSDFLDAEFSGVLAAQE